MSWQYKWDKYVTVYVKRKEIRQKSDAVGAEKEPDLK